MMAISNSANVALAVAACNAGGVAIQKEKNAISIEVVFDLTTNAAKKTSR